LGFLIVGDVHVVPQELGDCQALVGLIDSEIQRPDVDFVVFMGDQHHNHNVLDSRCVAFWAETIKRLEVPMYFIIGNHDFVTPTIMQPHSMVAHKRNGVGVIIVDEPCSDREYAFMPYYPDPVKFVEDAVKLKQRCGYDTLFCHQTFVGADEGKGFYSQEAVDPSAVPFNTIISGHIHKPMKLGKVLYVGAPRWRTLTDAEVAKRYIYRMDDNGKIALIPTNTHCVRIYKYEDSEDSPITINLTPEQLKLADIRITVNGTSEYIAKRVAEFKAQYNAKCRGVPIRGKLVKASESEGIDKAFQKFSNMFVAPNGTDKQLLLQELSKRLQG
jgi:DNA repair exonuclease SbcCD nuclease subunit